MGNAWAKISIAAGALIALVVGISLSGGPPHAPRGTAAEANRETHPTLVRVKPSDPEIAARSVLVQRLGGEVLLSRNADERLPIASLTKLMSALVAAERLEPLSAVTFSPEAKSAGEPDDKRSSVPAGEQLKAEDVIKVLLVSSDNDAAYALAEAVTVAETPETAGGAFTDRIAYFAELMNQKAQALGLHNTHFSNPAGSDDPGNYSTARDIATLAAYLAAERGELLAATRIRESFVFGASGGRYGLVNTNPLLAEYPAIYGSKTGYDDQARGTLSMLYRLAPGELVAMVILGSPDRFGEGRALIQWLESSFRLEP